MNQFGIQYTHPKGEIFTIYSGKQITDSFLKRISFGGKTDYTTDTKKTPLCITTSSGITTKLYSVTRDAKNSSSFILTFSTRSAADVYIHAIRNFGESKRIGNTFLTPEIVFGFEDDEGYNIFVEIPSDEQTPGGIPLALMSEDTTTKYRYQGLVVHPKGLQHISQTQQVTKNSVQSALNPQQFPQKSTQNPPNQNQ